MKSPLRAAPIPSSCPHTVPRIAVLPSGIDELDAILPHEGLPVGRLTEISGARASGKRTIATEICAAVLQRRQNAAWIDGCGGFYPLPVLESGVALQQLLVVQLPQPSTIRATLKAADILLQATSALTLLVLDLGNDIRIRSTLSNSMIVRLQRSAESSGTTVVLITEKSAEQSSLGSLISLHLTVQRRGQYELCIAIAKSKLGRMQQQIEVGVDGPHDVSLDSTV